MLPNNWAIQYVEVEGRRIAYRAIGDENGSPVVLIHALASSSESWSETGARLAEYGFRVIALDLPGHGRSDWAGQDIYTLDSISRDVASALERLNLGPVSLMGHSLGGFLALALGARLRDHVQRIVVEAAPVPARNEADADAMARGRHKASLWRSMKLLGIRRLVRIAVLRKFDFKAARPILAELKKPMPAWWRGLARIDCPILVLTGTSDGLITSRANLLVANTPNSTLTVVGEGHHLHLNHHDAFLEAVIPFLSASTHDAPLAPKEADLQ